tara:strand:- start:549 stop:1364 length:816 start_codon:yes stop_codon:yes gene_type:complete
MSNGICLVAQNNSKTDYIRQAYALALSVLAKSPRTNISLITNDKVPNSYKSVFDKIIPIPWGDLALGSDWKIDNRWKVYHITPYENTLVFDVDMLVLDDISTTWDSSSSLLFTKNVTTYRNKLVTSRYYRKTFDKNNLPDVYSGMYQFTKCDETANFFKLLDIIMQNWKVVYEKYTPNDLQKWCSVDVSIAIALKILDTQGYCLDHSPMTFTHMKSHVQDLINPPSKWTDVLTVDYGNSIYINGYKQSGVLHYVEDEFLTEDMLAWLKEKV